MSTTPLATSSDIALNLALSLISASVAPVLLLDGDLSVVAASQSFLETFDIGTDRVAGVKMADLVTEQRDRAQQKHDLIRDKAVLIEEMRHRIANSLQIIASILLQGVRKLSSDESRDYLRDAHQRIMSVAAVQRQLSGAELGDVDLRDYLTDLCRSIGDSMIRDHDRLTLSATIDDTLVSSGKAVSLGLIVTELLINAIKHAFPKQRPGRITLDYRSQGEGWTLTVRDDGVGLPPDPSIAKPGLGAGIIRALAQQLGAVIVITDAEPGVRVSIVCAPPPLHTS